MRLIVFISICLPDRFARSAYPAADKLVLLSWLCEIYSVGLKYNAGLTSEPSWTPLVSAIAVLLDLILDDTTKIKSSVRKSALVRTRRALRLVCSPTFLRIVL